MKSFVQYLVTTCSLNRNQISDLIKKTRIKGSIIVGNQLMEKDSEYLIQDESFTALVLNMSSKGVSKNRNTLLKKANAKFITFIDDDMVYIEDAQEKIESFLLTFNGHCARFNVYKADEPIKQQLFKKEKRFTKNNMKSVGVWGEFFDRIFLLSNSIYFREEIGPGSVYNHGEDAIFNLDYSEYGTIRQFTTLAFMIEQATSTWHGENRDLKHELISHGYVYWIIYKRNAKLCSFLFLITHKKCYPKGSSVFMMYKWMKIGINRAKNHYLKGKSK